MILLVHHHLLEMFSVKKLKLKENNSMNISDIYHSDMNIKYKDDKDFLRCGYSTFSKNKHDRRE